MELLKKSVQSVLEKERIGSPVFLRCVLHVAGDASNLLSSVAEIRRAFTHKERQTEHRLR